MSDTIPISPAVRRFNGWVSMFDAMSFGQHDQYDPLQILDYFKATSCWSAHSAFRACCIELGYDILHTSQATRTVTVKETLYGI